MGNTNNINATEKLTEEDLFEEPTRLTLLKDYNWKCV